MCHERRRPCPRVCAANGLTLAETMVALAVIFVALLPLLAMLPGGTAARMQCEDRATTALLAQRKIEQVAVSLNTDFNATVDGAGTFAADGEPAYAYSVQTTLDPTYPVKTICVEVWRDADGNGTRGPQETATQLYTKAARRG
jgi:Tfp pilus assembly protein PilV